MYDGWLIGILVVVLFICVTSSSSCNTPQKTSTTRRAKENFSAQYNGINNGINNPLVMSREERAESAQTIDEIDSILNGENNRVAAILPPIDSIAPKIGETHTTMENLNQALNDTTYQSGIGLEDIENNRYKTVMADQMIYGNPPAMLRTPPYGRTDDLTYISDVPEYVNNPKPKLVDELPMEVVVDTATPGKEISTVWMEQAMIGDQWGMPAQLDLRNNPVDIAVTEHRQKGGMSFIKNLNPYGSDIHVEPELYKTSSPRYIGCYLNSFDKNAGAMNINQCVSAARRSGYTKFGLVNGDLTGFGKGECWMGNDYSSLGVADNCSNPGGVILGKSNSAAVYNLL